MRQTRDPLILFDALAREPWAFDFMQAMRLIECAFPDKPRWGKAPRPQDEPVRLGQEPSMSFAPASLSAFSPQKGAPDRMDVRFFGLLGPNGPLPLHITEHARHRLLHHGDETFARFLDIIHHRLLVLFYRAWAQAQPTVNLDRPGEDRFATYVKSLIGLGQPSLSQRDHIEDSARLFHAHALTREVRNAEGLEGILSSYFDLPIQVEQYVGHWLPIAAHDHSRLFGVSLGKSAVLGRRVWDRQSCIRLHIGPMTLAQFQAFLPGGEALPRLVDWVRFYTGGELRWDVRLILKHDEIPPPELSRGARLGWTAWLRKRRIDRDADELVLDAERLLRRMN
jgi:type VI secretion system protein ImpH